MSRVVVGVHVTLDGVMQAPGYRTAFAHPDVQLRGLRRRMETVVGHGVIGTSAVAILVRSVRGIPMASFRRIDDSEQARRGQIRMGSEAVKVLGAGVRGAGRHGGPQHNGAGTSASSSSKPNAPLIMPPSARAAAGWQPSQPGRTRRASSNRTDASPLGVQVDRPGHGRLIVRSGCELERYKVLEAAMPHLGF